MRRVVIELPEEEIKKLGGYAAELSRDVESLKVVHHVRHGTKGSAVICKITPKDSGLKVDSLKFKFKRFEVLSEQGDGFLVYLEAEAVPLSAAGPNPPKVYLNFPFEIRAGTRRVTFVGDADELKKLFRWLEKAGVRFEIISNSDARSSPDSVLNSLPEQQRRALFAAYADGYYEVPRRVNLDSLARRQKIHKSTFAEHLMKAENRLISLTLDKELNYMRSQEKRSSES